MIKKILQWVSQSELVIIITNVIVNRRLFDSFGQEIEFLVMNTCRHPNRG